jgi:hypothetical protein
MTDKFQLVVQFNASSLADYDQLVELESRLIEYLAETAEVDGRDFGSDEFNIFILTADARRTFELVQKLITSQTNGDEMRAAYRSITADEYIPLWPTDLKEFQIS